MIGFKRYLKLFWAVILILLGACTKLAEPVLTPVLETSTNISATATVVPIANCTSVNVAPTPGTDESSLFPAVGEKDHIRGSMNADVTIVVYSDFQCPGCASLAPVLSQLESTFPSKLRVVFRQLPLYDIHDKALLAAQASEASSDEGKFWEMHDLLYMNYTTWISMPPDEFKNWLVQQSVVIGLNSTTFSEKLTSQEIVDRVEGDLEQALKIGLRTTPFLLINGQMYNGPRDYGNLETIIQLILLGKRQYSTCPEMSIDPLKQYIATLHTDKGDIVIQLYSDKAPTAVNSFVFLARNGWFDNIPFHRVIPEFVAQTGDPSGTGLGGPGYVFENEINDTLRFDQMGVVGMANSGENSNGSQFFITLEPQPDLNGRYTIFGQVIDGMDVVLKLTPRNPGTDPNPAPGDILISVTIMEK
jgi:cyclophilin family peptidyl-prolyl cis-trans isomerase/protein-disulfide isomerase